VTPAEFLASWQIDHINMGTQQTDAAKLSQELVQAAAAEGISRDDLEVVAGKDLETHIRDAIREAIEEEMW
jgi:hypothetical protein